MMLGCFHALHTMGLVSEGGTYIGETLSGTLEIVVGKDAILICRILNPLIHRSNRKSCTVS